LAFGRAGDLVSRYLEARIAGASTAVMQANICATQVSNAGRKLIALM
jgi:hypothetical protein